MPKKHATQGIRRGRKIQFRISEIEHKRWGQVQERLVITRSELIRRAVNELVMRESSSAA